MTFEIAAGEAASAAIFVLDVDEHRGTAALARAYTASGSLTTT